MIGQDGRRDGSPQGGEDGREDGARETAVDAVTDDLLRLRKGRGLRTPDLASRVGPALAAAVGLDLTGPRAGLRHDLQAGIVEAARQMPADLREAVLVGLAVEGWSDEPFLTDRISAVARAMDRDARTARRRLDTATRMLADAVLARRRPAGGNAYAPPGWYVESLAATLRLDLPSARLTEDRVVVAETDGLDTLFATLSLPPLDPHAAPDLAVVAEAGCLIRGATRVSESYWRYELALPRPLRAGEAHRYVLGFSVPDRAAMRPYYTLIPLRRTRRFSAEIRFAGPDAVALAWRLDGVPQVVLEDGEPTADLLRLDEAGVVRVRFEHLEQGLCYGARWRWA
jgi:hypothetical protein